MNTLTLAIVDPIAEAVRGGITGAAIAVVAAKAKRNRLWWTLH